MRTGSPCKGCSADVNVPDAQIEKMVRKMERFPELCVPESEYRRRLDTCFSCPSLQYGSTCAHCGCIVQVRAKLREKSCPAPGGSRWDAE